MDSDEPGADRSVRTACVDRASSGQGRTSRSSGPATNVSLMRAHTDDSVGEQQSTDRRRWSRHRVGEERISPGASRTAPRHASTSSLFDRLPSLRPRIGLSLGQGAIRMVGVRGRRLLWAARAERTAGESLLQSITGILRTAPGLRWPRPRVSAAVGAYGGQVKPLTGVPAVADLRVAERVVREGAARFFLRNGSPLVVTGVRASADSTLEPVFWAAAIEEPIYEALTASCAAAGMTLERVMPVAVALGHAPSSTDASDEIRVTWVEEGIRTEAAYRGTQVVQSGRYIEHETAESLRLIVEERSEAITDVALELGVLGESAWEFAPAYGAAVADEREPLALRADRRNARSGAVPRWRVVLAATLAMAAIMAVAFAPGIVAKRAGDGASATLRSLGPEYRAALIANAELSRVSSALQQLSDFALERRSATTFLGELARALPSSTVLVSLRTDSAGGMAIALAPRGSAVPAQLERIKGITTAEIVGPVTREALAIRGHSAINSPAASGPPASRELERVTVRFRLARGVESGSSS